MPRFHYKLPTSNAHKNMLTYKTKQRLRQLKWWLWIVTVILLVAAWPASYFRFGIALENTPAYGWIVDFHAGDGSDFDGAIVSINGGHFWAFTVANVPHTPKPGVWLPDALDSDTSHLFFLGKGENPLGVLGMGRFSSGWAGGTSWVQKTGLILPLWPVSIVAAYFLFRGLRRMLKSRKRSNTLCPTCSYDLRAHAPGSNCPECGTPIPAPQTNA
jgi:hypothetical protein